MVDEHHENQDQEQEQEIDLSDISSDAKPGSGTKKVDAGISNSSDEQNDQAKSGDILTADQLASEILSKSEDDFLPWEDVVLPSKGFYYGDRVPGGVVQIKPMGIQDEKILATQRLASTGQSIDYILDHCVNTPGEFDLLDMLTGDRVFLLYYLRGITHGNMYEFVLQCPNCSTSSNHTYDLNELAQTIKYPNESLGQEPFKIVLPKMSKYFGKTIWVKVRFMRGRDISHIANRQRFNKRIKSSVGAKKSKDVVFDETVTENIAMLITSFGGDGIQGEVKDTVKIKSMVDKMHAGDTSKIREFLRVNAPGIDTSIEVECPECGHNFRTELPITETFFRPSSED